MQNLLMGFPWFSQQTVITTPNSTHQLIFAKEKYFFSFEIGNEF
jgi:hypothetical protein